MGAQVLLAVAGNVGSGKTTLTERLVDRLGWVGIFEGQDENPYLSDFYRDMRRWSLPSQLRFLVGRVRDTRAVVGGGASAICDRTCWEDADIFAANLHGRGDMDDRDWETYRMVADTMLADLRPPDLLVYMRRSVASCRAMIARRGRAYEDAIPEPYLADLASRYDAWFAAWDRSRKISIDAEAYDVLRSDSDLEAVVARVRESLPQRQLF